MLIHLAQKGHRGPLIVFFFFTLNLILWTRSCRTREALFLLRARHDHLEKHGARGLVVPASVRGLVGLRGRGQGADYPQGTAAVTRLLASVCRPL